MPITVFIQLNQVKIKSQLFNQAVNQTIAFPTNTHEKQSGKKTAAMFTSILKTETTSINNGYIGN